ncbi:hypothetical protein GCM10020331_080600 [Ectobacillus funiculus]
MVNGTDKAQAWNHHRFFHFFSDQPHQSSNNEQHDAKVDPKKSITISLNQLANVCVEIPYDFDT